MGKKQVFDDYTQFGKMLASMLPTCLEAVVYDFEKDEIVSIFNGRFSSRRPGDKVPQVIRDRIAVANDDMILGSMSDNLSEYNQVTSFLSSCKLIGDSIHAPIGGFEVNIQGMGKTARAHDIHHEVKSFRVKRGWGMSPINKDQRSEIADHFIGSDMMTKGVQQHLAEELGVSYQALVTKVSADRKRRNKLELLSK
jgi:hypothetical protein